MNERTHSSTGTVEVDAVAVTEDLLTWLQAGPGADGERRRSCGRPGPGGYLRVFRGEPPRRGSSGRANPAGVASPPDGVRRGGRTCRRCWPDGSATGRVVQSGTGRVHHAEAHGGERSEHD